jgi:hypothetical protein
MPSEARSEAAPGLTRRSCRFPETVRRLDAVDPGFWAGEDVTYAISRWCTSGHRPDLAPVDCLIAQVFGLFLRYVAITTPELVAFASTKSSSM